MSFLSHYDLLIPAASSINKIEREMDYPSLFQFYSSAMLLVLANHNEIQFWSDYGNEIRAPVTISSSITEN